MNNPSLLFHPKFGESVLCHSDTAKRCGLDNACPDSLKANLCALSHLLGQIEELLADQSLTITSAYRSPALNREVGGVEKSQHVLGLAADIQCKPWGSAYALAQRISESNLGFDQLILEFNRWVHVSVAPEGQNPRGERLSIFSSEEGYLEGIIQR